MDEVSTLANVALEEATAEWDEVDEVEPTHVGLKEEDNEHVGDQYLNEDPKSPTDLNITIEEVRLYLEGKVMIEPRTTPTARTTTLTTLLECIASLHWSVSRFVPCLLLFKRPTTKQTLQTNFILTLAKTGFDSSDNVHLSLLTSLYRGLISDPCAPCPRFGSHWERIGFQGADPATDLRGVGLLGLLSPLHALSTSGGRACLHEALHLSHSEVQHFPLMALALNLSRIALDLLRSSGLNRLSDAKGFDVWETFHHFHTALLARFHIQWREQECTIVDTARVLKDLETLATRHPLSVLDEYEQRYGAD